MGGVEEQRLRSLADRAAAATADGAPVQVADRRDLGGGAGQEGLVGGVDLVAGDAGIIRAAPARGGQDEA